MKYELAKELKDAGFSQNPTNLELTIQDKVEHQECYIPRLEELIEACSGRLYKLEFSWLVSEWFAEGMYEPESPDKLVQKHSRGSTPTEAVARLWLALNKKDGTK